MPGQQVMQRPKGQQGGSGGGGRKRSFLVGTQDVLEGGDYDQTFTNVSGGALPPWTLQGTGWLARLWFYVTYTTTGGSALTADAPYILFNTVQLNDVNNEAIFGPFDGYTWSPHEQVRRLLLRRRPQHQRCLHGVCHGRYIRRHDSAGNRLA